MNFKKIKHKINCLHNQNIFYVVKNGQKIPLTELNNNYLNQLYYKVCFGMKSNIYTQSLTNFDHQKFSKVTWLTNEPFGFDYNVITPIKER